MSKVTEKEQVLQAATVGSKELESQLQWLMTNTRIVPCVHGETGIGKSTIVREVARWWHTENLAGNIPFAPEEEKALRQQQVAPATVMPPQPIMSSEGCIDIRLGQMVEPSELIGIPVLQERTVGTRVVKQTHHAIPEIYPLWHDYHMVFFLDELNRAQKDVLQAVFQLILDRRIYTHALPDGMRFVAACNPDNGVYQVSELDPALRDRMLHIVYEADIDEFIEWAQDRFTPDILTYLYDHRDQLQPAADAIEVAVQPSPRAWEMADDIMQQWDLKDPFCTDRNLTCLLAGLVGDRIAQAFVAQLYSGGQKALSAQAVFEEASFPEDALAAQRDDVSRTFYTSMDVMRWWRKRPLARITDEHRRRLDRYLGSVSEDTAYGITFNMTQDRHQGTAGYQAINGCTQALQHLSRIVKDRKEYAKAI